MFRKRALVLVIAAGAFGLYLAWPRYPAWPRLPRTHIMLGRPASPEDVRQGSAAFALERRGLVVGEVVPIVLPQYAWRYARETGQWFRAIVIQAERAPNGHIFYGLRSDPANIGGVFAIEEHVILLGPERPGRIPPPGQPVGNLPPVNPAGAGEVNVILGLEQQGGGA